MIFGLSAISDMSTGQMTDQIVLDQQAADAATALAAVQAPTSSMLPLLLLVAAAGAGYWWFVVKGKSVSLPSSLTAFTG